MKKKEDGIEVETDMTETAEVVREAVEEKNKSQESQGEVIPLMTRGVIETEVGNETLEMKEGLSPLLGGAVVLGAVGRISKTEEVPPGTVITVTDENMIDGSQTIVESTEEI